MRMALAEAPTAASNMILLLLALKPQT
jgi:hypothetical protein